MEIEDDIDQKEIDFAIKNDLVFDVVTTQTLLIVHNNLIDYIRGNCYKFKPVGEFNNIKLAIIPTNAQKVKVEKTNMPMSVLGYIIAKYGRIKEISGLIYEQTDDGYLNFLDVKNIPSDITPKLPYIFAKLTTKLIESEDFKNVFITYISSKKLRPTKNRKLFFPKSHILLEGKERQELKKEIQSISSYMQNLITYEQLKIEIGKHIDVTRD